MRTYEFIRGPMDGLQISPRRGKEMADRLYVVAGWDGEGVEPHSIEDYPASDCPYLYYVYKKQPRRRYVFAGRKYPGDSRVVRGR